MNSIGVLWRSLRALKGNQRACVLAEPLWSVPNNLFMPFASMYMSAIGVSDARIGWIASLGLATQFIWCLLSGAVLDKYGRRGTMLAFGILSWTVPCMIWALAKDVRYFALAAVFNGMWRVTANSFSCTIIEDGDPDKLIHIHAILNAMGLLAGFLAPLAGLFIHRFSLITTMRALYASSMALMTGRFVLQYRLTCESGIGVSRMAEYRGRSLFRLALGGWPAFISAIRRKPMQMCALLMVLMTCVGMIQANFWPLFVQSAYGVRDATLTLFPFVKSAITLIVYLVITPRLSLHKIRRPLLIGLGAQGLGLIVLLAFMPIAPAAPWAVFLSAGCDALALAVLGPLSESLMALSIPGKERARVNGMVFAAILLISAPAAWIAGQLSEISRALPLAMNLCLIAAEIAVALRVSGAVEGESGL